MVSPAPRIFTIPASAPFLETVIAELCAGRLVPGFPGSADPLALARATLYLPTRRACRLARDLFLDGLDAGAAILPRIVPIGDIDEDEIAFAEAATGALAAEALALPETLQPLERRMMLAQLILKWTATPAMRSGGDVPLVANTPAAALALADSLARLMDDMVTRQVAWERLDDLVPDDVDVFWQRSLEFLKLARENWPAILADRGAIEPAVRRDLLIAAEAKRLAGSDGPVIAAGSTGSMPATAQLLATIAGLPHGAVVLPGLDTDLDAHAWEAISTHEGHPQFAMHALLHKLGITRDAVTPLASPTLHGRERFVSEALRPSATTDRWRARSDDAAFAAHRDAAAASLAVIAAAHAEEEALAIAVALREAAETPGKTAALVTPDRALTRRVVAQLARWDLAVDDFGGEPLAETPAGIFARLTCAAALGRLAPVDLLALLKHPLTQLGVGDQHHAVTTLERAVLRGPRPRAGTAGLAHALATFRRDRDTLYRADPRRSLRDDEIDAASTLVALLARALAPLEQAPSGPLAVAAWAERHRDAVAALGGEAAFAGVDGNALAETFEALSEQATSLTLAPGDYAELFVAVLATRAVRRHELPGVRIRVFGPLEARLQTIDRVVLGGLTEGVWPPETRNDAWLSRPMRRELGLDAPERRISLSAHDFAQALGAREVVLSYAAKVGGAPTVVSRFVQRLAAVAGEARWAETLANGAKFVAWARALDAPAGKAQPAPRPEPKPPLAARPSRLSVTEIEHWLRDPYTIYAKNVLNLRPLEAVDTPPGAADRGTVIHGAVGDFTEAYAAALPDDPLGELMRLGREKFAPLDDYPEAVAFWWPRFGRIAKWFVAWEAERRPQIAALIAEQNGKIEIPLAGGGAFTLTTRADRIERLTDGRYALLDYKTGTVPSSPQVQSGLAPQLTLEGAILRQGGFTGIAAGGSIAAIIYVSLKGGDPAGDPKVIAFKDSAPDAEADRALTKLAGVVARFQDEAQPYLPMVVPMWKNRYGDYDHLARIKEWSIGREDEDGE